MCAAPGPGEVRIRQHAVGLNFIDVYFRTGLYKAPGLPFIAGNEAAGEVVAVGPGVTNFHPGDRVAYYFNLGGYATERNIPGDKLVKLPDHITYEQGAVLMLKGLTVWYLLHKTFKVEPPSRADPCRGRRHRPARLPMGAGRSARMSSAPSAPRPRPTSRSPMAATTSSSTTRKISSPASNRSAATNSATSSMTASARRLFRARCPASSRAACSSVSATPRARCRRSRSPNSTITARCSRPGRSSTIMSAPARNCSKAPTRCSPPSSTASCTCRSITPTR